MGSLPPPEDYDVLILGAGMSGMCALHHIRTKLPQLRVRVLEAAPDVGGTWYWNCYPGARFDSESVSYAFSFDKGVLDEWRWTEAFAPQPETLRYLRLVADRLDLKKDIQFNTRVTTLHWSDEDRLWKAVDERGTVYTTRFLVSCIGFLSNPTLPNIPGISSFAGQSFHTSRWPRELQGKQAEEALAGKRIGVIGTGATGIQTITALAQMPDIPSLTVFQRHATWTVPLRNSQFTPDQAETHRQNADAIFRLSNSTPTGFLHQADPRKTADVSLEDRLAHYESIYNKPGMAKWLGAFSDTYTDRAANEEYSQFIAEKIKERVNDPDLATRLVPTDHGFGLRRVPLESGYFEAFNKEHVHLVDLKETPVQTVTPGGIQTTDGKEHPLDVLVYATGFNAITGSFVDMDIRGREGVPLMGSSVTGEKTNAVWMDYRPRTFLGITVPQCPNLFMVLGPHQPFGNAPRSIEHVVQVVVDLLATCVDKKYTFVEPTTTAVEDWTSHVISCSDGALLNEVDSWMTGVNTNVKGRGERSVARYAGSLVEYKRRCRACQEAGWEGLQMK
ncbi:hypothetical protein SEUCBS140593_001665 [Sporothrix eucalyptigena]|uniref:Cyclohexanone monooxygenase n=1 Tax=Sporothrix eucalyptigena TaxID=1812306 RepID=A0ABP0B071_9PEZI